MKLVHVHVIQLSLFVYVEFIVPLENFSLIWRRHHCGWKAANFEICSALMAIEQWVFFNVPHLLWHGSTLYNGHLRGHVTLTPVAELLAVELSLPVCCDRRSNPDLPHARRTLYLYATAAVVQLRDEKILNLTQYSFLAHLSRRLKWAFLIKFCPLSVVVVVVVVVNSFTLYSF